MWITGDLWPGSHFPDVWVWKVSYKAGSGSFSWKQVLLGVLTVLNMVESSVELLCCHQMGQGNLSKVGAYSESCWAGKWMSKARKMWFVTITTTVFSGLSLRTRTAVLIWSSSSVLSGPYIRKIQILLQPLFGLISVWCLTPVLECALWSYINLL